MTLTIVALLFLLLVGIYINARMRTARHLRCIAEEKGDIARASGMTASIGVFYPDVSATVVMGVSEEIGACYYRVLRDGKVINRSRINLANIKRVELLINGDVRNVGISSTQATSFLKATDVAGRILSQYSPYRPARHAPCWPADCLCGRKRCREAAGDNRAAYD